MEGRGSLGASVDCRVRIELMTLMAVGAEVDASGARDASELEGDPCGSR